MSTVDKYPSGSIWTEHETNPAPEVMVHSAPEAVYIPMKTMGTGNDGANDVRLGQPDRDIAVPSDAEQASQPNPERRSRLWNWKTIIGICIGLAILSIVIPVVVTVTAASQRHDRGNTKTTTTPSLISTSSSSAISMSRTTAPAPSSTLIPALKCVKSKFIQTVGWIGIDKSVGGWKFNLHPAKTAEDCCTICYHSTPDGCNGWLYMPGASFTPACSIIHGFTGSNKSETCPNGRPDIVFAKTDSKDNYGGPGPCASSARE